MKTILAIMAVFTAASGTLSAYLLMDMRRFKCDVFEATFSEREYVYPILRSGGYDPSDYGRDVKNPITTSSRYSKSC